MVVLAVVLVVVAGVPVWSWERNVLRFVGTPDTIRAMESDPMGSRNLLGLTLVYAETVKQDSWGAEKGVEDQVIRYFAPRGSTDDTAREIVAYAESLGWEVDGSSAESMHLWVGRRSVSIPYATRELSFLVKTVGEDPKRANTVRISLGISPRL